MIADCCWSLASHAPKNDQIKELLMSLKLVPTLI